MKKITIAGIIIFSLIITVQPRQAKAQAFDEVAFLDNLSKKDKATVGDALTLFELVISKKDTLVKESPAKTAALKKGFISLKVANALNLTDSVVFTLFRSERYAFRACVAHGLLNADASEYDTMSGEELIEFLTFASEYKDKGASK